MKEETKVENKSEKNIKLHKKLFNNIIIAIMIMIYFIFINLGSINIEPDIFFVDIKVFSMIILGIAIIIFEKAYKKDNDDLAIYGIEVLILACHTLSINHVTNIFNLDFTYYILTSSYFFAIYYVFKDILIYTKENRKRLESLSDISDIVKKEKPSKKEAKKKVKVEENKKTEANNKEEQKNEKEIDKKQEKTKATKKNNKVNSTSKKETKTSKATKSTKKSKNTESNKEEKIENKTTKKSTKTTKKEKVEEKQEVENKPKKKKNTKKEGGIKND